MSERYGNKPKAFTKKWWGYFWLYYKIPVLAALFVILIASGICIEIISRTEYDSGIIYCGSEYFGSDDTARIEEVLNTYAKDANGDGEILTKFESYSVLTTQNSQDYNEAMQTKMIASFNDDDYLIYLSTYKTATDYMAYGEEMFVPTEVWYTGDGRKTADYNGKSYAVSLEGSSAMKMCGIDTSDLYMFVTTKKDNSYPDKTVMEIADNIAK